MKWEIIFFKLFLELQLTNSQIWKNCIKKTGKFETLGRNGRVDRNRNRRVILGAKGAWTANDLTDLLMPTTYSESKVQDSYPTKLIGFYWNAINRKMKMN